MAPKQIALPSFPEFFDRFANESDRAAGVLGAAFLDVQLGRVFRARLSQATPERVFEFRGPLGDFSARIDMALGLNWIDEATFSDLHIIRKIRNDFAHHPDHDLTFANDSISDRLSNLNYVRYTGEHVDELERLLPDVPGKEEAVAQTRANYARPRSRFTGAVGLLAGILADADSARATPPSLREYYLDIVKDTFDEMRKDAAEMRRIVEESASRGGV